MKHAPPTQHLALELADLVSQLLMHHDSHPIGEGHPFVLHRSDQGAWGIALLVDGWYGERPHDLDDWLWADHYRRLWPLLARYREARRAEGLTRTRERCPVCSAPSVYVRALDRFMHIDGTENRSCWLAILRGEHD